MATETKKPLHTIRVASVKAAIWENETEKGTFRNVTFVRPYKKGEQWKDSTSFSSYDLEALMDAALEAKEWLRKNPVSEGKAA